MRATNRNPIFDNNLLDTTPYCQYQKVQCVHCQSLKGFLLWRVLGSKPVGAYYCFDCDRKEINRLDAYFGDGNRIWCGKTLV